MLLRHIGLENFRGARRLEMALGETTVLVGENGSGKSSVIDALKRCLGIAEPEGRFRFRPHDLFRPAGPGRGEPAGPARIALTFEEREPGEWTAAHREPFGPAVVGGRDRRAALRLEVRAAWRPPDPEVAVSYSFLDARGAPVAGVDAAATLRALRRLNPFIMLGDRTLLAERIARALASASPETPADLFFAEAAADPRRMVEELFERISAGGLVPDEGLGDGERAARQVWQRLLGAGEELGRRGARPPARPPGAGALSLGPLLVFGSLLAEGSHALDPLATPLLAVEEIEAHLHPSVMSSVWYVVDSIPAQKIVSTHSGEMLAAMPVGAIRRFVRRAGDVEVYRLRESGMSREELRRVGYHVRARRGNALFARCWLLVEGETEFWLLPELARQCGYELSAEGVAVVEFAQSGVEPIVKLANDLGIAWHLVADGDAAGHAYAAAARALLGGAPREERITALPAADVETYLWRSGYAEVYLAAANPFGGREPRADPHRGGESRRGRGSRRADPRRVQNPRGVIARAVRASSKPSLALSVLEAAAEPGSPGVPPALRAAVETAVRLAREG